MTPSLRPALTLLLFAAISLLITPPRLFASPLPPSVRASRSINGQFLVVTEYEYANPDNDIARIRRTTYRVMQLERFINSKDRLIAPVPFWSESWDVTIEGAEGRETFWPMISDDGRSLVLVAVNAPVPGLPMLKIYRNNSYKSELVRSYQISDLWTAKQVNPDGRGIFMVTGATPQWFSGGSLTFSPDGEQLVYRNQWNEVVRINLKDGMISRGER